MKNGRNVSLILACFNEVDVFVPSVTRIIETLRHSKLTYEIIFVDDKSADNTRDLIVSACKKYPHCRAIFHGKNYGRGKTVADGFVQSKGEVVGFIDIDCEVGPEYIPQLVSMILEHKSDVVIGKRIYRSSPNSFIREVLSRGYQWLSDFLIGTGGLDTETGYKFFRRSKVIPLLALTKNPGWFWDTEIMVRAKRAGLTIREVPVLFLRRFDKQSSVNIVRDSADYLINLWSFRKELARK